MTLTPLRMPEGRAGQVLAVVAPICILLAVFFGFVQPALQWYGARQQRLADGQIQIAHILAQQRVLPQLRQQARAAAAASGKAQILLAGNSDAIADANLQSDLTAIAANSGTSLTSTAVLPAQMFGALRRVGVAVNVTASWTALTDLLASIENTRPRMIVDDLSVSSSGAADASDTSLQASFAVFAFRSGGTQ